jgi:hypothetical protein
MPAAVAPEATPIRTKLVDFKVPGDTTTWIYGKWCSDGQRIRKPSCANSVKQIDNDGTQNIDKNAHWRQNN